VLPTEKGEFITHLRARGGIVAMVGDGVNDCLALACADVGIAVGVGTEIAAESADIVLVRSNMSDVLVAFDIARATFRRIRINFVWAYGNDLISLPLAARNFYPLMLARLQPWVAGLAIALSSMTVVTSSLLLQRHRVRVRFAGFESSGCLEREIWQPSAGTCCRCIGGSWTRHSQVWRARASPRFPQPRPSAPCAP
jgi:cation transport ATPase